MWANHVKNDDLLSPDRTSRTTHLLDNASSVSSSRQAQQVYGVYPFASATPSTHIARHLSNLSLTTAPPSYTSPFYYNICTTGSRDNPDQYDVYYTGLNSQSSNNSPMIGGIERISWGTAYESLKHPRTDSNQFFNSFLDEKARSITESHIFRDKNRTLNHPMPCSNYSHETSIIQPISPMSFSPLVVTPKKRKQVEVLINSPSKQQNSPIPMEKLENLIDDIFEAEDTISVDTGSENPFLKIFSKNSLDHSRPTLTHTMITRLTNTISKLSRPSRRSRLLPGIRDMNTPSSPRKIRGTADIELQTLIRIMKILERSIHQGELVDPFGSPTEEDYFFPANANNSKAPDEDKPDEESIKNLEDMVTQRDSIEMSNGTIELFLNRLESQLEIARDSVAAADCCIALLASDRLPKQLYSEDLIASCLSLVRNQLTAIIYPFSELSSADTRELSLALKVIASRPPAAISRIEKMLPLLCGEIYKSICSILPRINNLVCGDSLAMPDAIVIQTVYIALGPFFIVEFGDIEHKIKKSPLTSLVYNTLGNSGLRGLRLEALSLIRTVFAKYEEQRNWIIEEILSSLVKLSASKQKAGLFRLRDGRSIRTVSALLLQLVQTSAHDVYAQARQLAKNRHQQNLGQQGGALTDVSHRSTDQLFMEEIKLYSYGLDAPSRCAKSIVMFLTQRSGRGKSTKNANEQEYRTIFENLISDLLVVLYWPEWPAASVVLSIVLKYMMATLEDLKSPATNENNAGKATALDHLGSIAGRLRNNSLKWCEPDGTVAGPNCSFKSVDDLAARSDVLGLESLISAHREVSAYLYKSSSGDQAYESAWELSSVIWGHELSSAFTQLDDKVRDDGAPTTDQYLFKVKIMNVLCDLWKNVPTDVFDNTTQEEVNRIDSLSERIGVSQSLKNAFDPILSAILTSLDAAAVFVRTKALRSLGQILLVDASILSNPNVRHAIETHLLDSSSQVRDAAVELIGKYMVESHTVANEYYQKISERIADTGLGVRKRVVKLLKVLYSMTDDLQKRIDICSKIIMRMLDEDDSIKELAVKTMEELWFNPQATIRQPLGNSTEDNRHQTSNAAVITGVCGSFKDRQSPLDDLLNKILSSRESSCNTLLQDQFSSLIDALIEGLIDTSTPINSDTVNVIKTIHLFAIACPSLISGPRATALLTYLRNPTTPEEHLVSDYIMKIYSVAIPHMSRTSAKFGSDLQLVLQPMVLKPSAQTGFTSLPITVACLCVTVQYLTHDFTRLVALMRSCNARVQQFLRKATSQLDGQEVRALHIVVLILSLLGENFDFDGLRDKDKDVADQLGAISEGSIVKHIYACVLKLYEKFTDSGIRGRLLVCLGFLFRAQPTLMTLEGSASMMDAIFESLENENRARLLKLMLEFLVAEAEKHAVQERESTKQKSDSTQSSVNMEELIGNSHGFADSGVSSAIVQRYLPQILECALSSYIQIQTSAVDILTHTVKLGLAHPLMSFPVIVALETSPINALSARASALHTVLHHKHASLLSSGYITACRKSFDYQSAVKREGAGPIEGYRLTPLPIALLSRWYALVREKRAMRQEFIRSVLRVFEVPSAKEKDEDMVQFARYMAGNFAHFDYRTQEEVLTVIKTLTKELAETGVMLIEAIAPGMLSEQLRAAASHKAKMAEGGILASPTNREGFTGMSLNAQISMMYSTCVIGIAMILKAHLKSTYGIAEEKCQKFVLGKKSAIGDRPATRRKETAISWERLPYVSRAIETQEDVERHKRQFLELWAEDGLTAEPVEDEQGVE